MSRLRVMVVGEQEDFRKKIAAVLGERGYETFPAADGIDALRQIYSVMPQLIVSEAGLASLSGFEFLPFVKRRFPSMRVIALSGNPSETVTRKMNFVPDALLAKHPWDAGALLEAAEELLSREATAETEEVDCA